MKVVLKIGLLAVLAAAFWGLLRGADTIYEAHQPGIPFGGRLQVDRSREFMMQVDGLTRRLDEAEACSPDSISWSRLRIAVKQIPEARERLLTWRLHPTVSADSLALIQPMIDRMRNADFQKEEGRLMADLDHADLKRLREIADLYSQALLTKEERLAYDRLQEREALKRGENLSHY